MDTKLQMGSEVVVTAKDRTGILSDISAAVSKMGVNITAICGYATDETAHVRLITADNKRAVMVLKEMGYNAELHQVVVSQMSPHKLHPDMSDFAGAYDVRNNYWCAATHNGEHAIFVFSPTDSVKATIMR